jgi:ParB family transcriptional regulator, chromosome partitioning protein
VPVSIRPKKEAVERLLAENQPREDMHPVDAIEAYTLTGDHKRQVRVFGEFGNSAHVLEGLRLVI